jgi:hypothetical protein
MRAVPLSYFIAQIFIAQISSRRSILRGAAKMGGKALRITRISCRSMV